MSTNNQLKLQNNKKIPKKSVTFKHKNWQLRKIKLLKLKVYKKVKLMKPKPNKERSNLIKMIVIADIMIVMEEDNLTTMIVDLITEVNMKTVEVEIIITRKDSIVIMMRNEENKKAEPTRKM